MTGEPRGRTRRFWHNEDGVTLLETMAASGLLTVAMLGLAGMTTLAVKLTENEGHLSTRAAEYAVDKMEQLQELTYGDAQSNTTVFPSLTSGGTGLADGGSSDPANAVVGYSDYLDVYGTPLCTVATPCTGAAPATWFYQRAWQVCSSASAGTTGCPQTLPANIKQLIVTATVRSSVGNVQKAKTTVASYKTNCPSGC